MENENIISLCKVSISYSKAFKNRTWTKFTYLVFSDMKIVCFCASIGIVHISKKKINVNGPNFKTTRSMFFFFFFFFKQVSKRRAYRSLHNHCGTLRPSTSTLKLNIVQTATWLRMKDEGKTSGDGRGCLRCFIAPWKKTASTISSLPEIYTGWNCRKSRCLVAKLLCGQFISFVS